MAKASYKSRVNAAVVAYTKGSRKLVELFEEAATRYYGEDSRTVDNLGIFLNAIKAFPVLQKAAIESTRTFGKFDITVKDGDVTIKNRGKMTEDQRAEYVKVVEAYVAKQYNSLLAAHQGALLKAFDFDQRLKGFKNSATSIVVNAVAEGKATKAEAIARLKAQLEALEAEDLEDKITARQSEIAAEKITGDQIADAVAQAANSETPVAETNVA